MAEKKIVNKVELNLDNVNKDACPLMQIEDRLNLIQNNFKKIEAYLKSL